MPAAVWSIKAPWRQGTETHHGSWRKGGRYDKETKILREGRAGRRHGGWSLEQGSHQPLRRLLSLSTSPRGRALSQRHCSPGGCSIASVTNSLCLLRAFLLLHHFALHVALTLTLFLLCLWLSFSLLPYQLNGPIPNSQERNLIDQLWSDVPCSGQSAMPRVCLVFPEVWAEKGL